MLSIYQSVLCNEVTFQYVLESHRIMSGTDRPSWSQAVESLQLGAMYYIPLKYS